MNNPAISWTYSNESGKQEFHGEHDGLHCAITKLDYIRDDGCEWMMAIAGRSMSLVCGYYPTSQNAKNSCEAIIHHLAHWRTQDEVRTNGVPLR